MKTPLPPSASSPPDGPVTVTVRARTDLGRTRDHNEDAFLVADLGTGATDIIQDGPHPVGERGMVFLVADGMGGAAAGELASSMAVELIFRNLAEAAKREPDGSPEHFALVLRAAVEDANERIHAYSREHPDVRGMGTTATLAGVLGGTLFLAQVGDSRGYLVRGGLATQITKDQSLMQRLVDAGELTEEEAEQSERRNIILQALGPDARIRVDLTWQELRQGDLLVICSDGLSGQVKREEIATLASDTRDLDQLAEQLIAVANERGGPDNITVVLVRFDGAGLAPPDAGGHVGYKSIAGDEADEDESDTPEPDAVIPAPPAEPVEAPPAPEPAPNPAPAAGPRSGSPAAIAGLTTGLLILLVILYFLLRS